MAVLWSIVFANAMHNVALGICIGLCMGLASGLYGDGKKKNTCEVRELAEDKTAGTHEKTVKRGS